MKPTILHLVKTARLSYTTSTQVIVTAWQGGNFLSFIVLVAFFFLHNSFFSPFSRGKLAKPHCWWHKSSVHIADPSTPQSSVSPLMLNRNKEKADCGENQFWFTTKQNTNLLLKNMQPWRQAWTETFFFYMWGSGEAFLFLSRYPFFTFFHSEQIFLR